ncbi:MAG: hypothetical protein LBM98_05110 [Oscillospiraceae bacterium]|jgi:hypothetical protein|nr:hypothetical protein [Oscillospiraceae bacterium]
MRSYEGYYENGSFKPTGQVTLPSSGKARITFLEDGDPRSSKRENAKPGKTWDEMTMDERTFWLDDLFAMIHASGEDLNEADFERVSVPRKIEWFEDPQYADIWGGN